MSNLISRIIGSVTSTPVLISGTITDILEQPIQIGHLRYTWLSFQGSMIPLWRFVSRLTYSLNIANNVE